MKRQYEEPQLEIVKFNVSVDIMTESSNVNTLDFDELQNLGTN